MSDLHLSWHQEEFAPLFSWDPLRAQVGPAPQGVHNPQISERAWAWQTVGGKSLLENQGWDVVAGPKASFKFSLWHGCVWVDQYQAEWAQSLAGKGPECSKQGRRLHRHLRCYSKFPIGCKEALLFPEGASQFEDE